MKFNVIVTDPPYLFNSPLKMKDGVDRSADSQYWSVMTLNDILHLDVKSVVADDALLALWVPSAMLAEGLETVKNYGFDFKQTFIWVKTKQIALSFYLKINMQFLLQSQLFLFVDQIFE